MTPLREKPKKSGRHNNEPHKAEEDPSARLGGGYLSQVCGGRS